MKIDNGSPNFRVVPIPNRVQSGRSVLLHLFPEGVERYEVILDPSPPM